MPTPYNSSNIIFVKKTGLNTIDPLLYDLRWKDSVITYSFPDINSVWTSESFIGYGPEKEPWNPSYAPLSLSNQDDFEMSLRQWGNVANIEFRNIIESANSVGDIRVAYTEVRELAGAEAWAYLPSDSALGGDIWINATSNSAIKDWTKGSHSFFAMLHEIGHVLGLEHPFEDPEFPVSLDTRSLTIMSYSAIPGKQGSYFDFYPTTPMLLDIQAIQYMYGVNDSFHSENNTYTYSDITTYHETIWDGGGIDTITYTGEQAAYIQLDEGEGSFIGNPVSAIDYLERKTVPNIWIAYETVIENASGASNDDVLIGNQFDNVLSGNDGNDLFIGKEGNDTFQGGTGIDQAFFPGTHAEYAVSISGEGFTVQQTGVNEQDRLIDIERLVFDDIGIALDIDGQAGQVAKLLGVVFGPESIYNLAYVSAGLILLDEGEGIQQLTMAALDAAGVNDDGELITLLWHSLFGNEPTPEEKQTYFDLLSDENLSAADLTLLAADSSFNIENINLVGLQQTGIEFAL